MPQPRAAALVGVHLDLKYAMPNKAFLRRWLDRLPGWGVNALLLEYEDKFPFHRHPFLRGADAFTPDELAEFLAAARAAGLAVIPLVQSLSHLEFALAHDELAGLREATDIPTQICPSNDQAVRFVLDLIDEVLAFHGPDPLFHCGGDEAWFLGACPRCEAWRRRSGPAGMWAEHQAKIARHVLDAGKRPIVWDDVVRDETPAAARAGLPRETILMSWDYGLTGMPAGPDSVLEHVGRYRREGYDSIACPCLNYGQLLPRVGPALANTRAWAAKAASENMLGLINSSWAVFHVPLQAQQMLVAATGELCRDPATDVGPAWQQRWLADWFGAPAHGAPEALETLGAVWEIPLPNCERPFTPLPYGYMNLVLHYPAAQADRRKRGAYPLDWTEIDFAAVYRKGVQRIRAADPAPIHARLDEILGAYGPACAALQSLASAATRHRDEADLLAALADFKHLAARVFAHVLRGEGHATALADELLAQRSPLAAALAQSYEPAGRQRLLAAWWQPLHAAVKP